MFNEGKLLAQNGTSATVRVKDWLLLDCIALLNLIPILGSIACIVIYLIIAFGSSSAVSLKNRVLASLIWVAIWIVIMLLFLFAFGGMAAIQSIMNYYYY